MAGAAPRYGICVAKVPDCAFIISAAKCGELPLPGVPKLKRPGLALSVAKNSWTLLALNLAGLISRNTSTRAADATGTMSWLGSNGILA